MLRLTLLLSLAFTLACPGEPLAPGDAGRDGSNDGVSDGSNDGVSDGTTPTGPFEDLCDAAENRCADGCPMPWLLAADEDLSDSRCGNRVRRYSLGSGGVCLCPSYSTSDENLRAVGYLPTGAGQGIVYAAGTRVIDFFGARAGSYTIPADILFSYQPVDIFAANGEDGALNAVVAFNGASAGTSGAMMFIAPGGTPRVETIASGRSRLLGGSDGYTQSSIRPSQLRYGDLQRPAIEVDIWTDELIELNYFADFVAGALYSYFDGTHHRTVLVPDSFVDTVQGVYAVAEETVTHSHMPPRAICSDAAFDDYRFVSALGDPRSIDHVFASMVGTSDRDRPQGQIVRLSLIDQSCEVISPPSEDHRAWRLALALDDYWSDD